MALKEFDLALRLQPDHFWAHCLSAICAVQTRQPERAKLSLGVCLQQEPGFIWLYVLRGFASGEAAALKTSARGHRRAPPSG